MARAKTAGRGRKRASSTKKPSRSAGTRRRERAAKRPTSAGKRKAAKRGAGREQHAIELLRAQHRQIEDLFEQFEHADHDEQQQVFYRFADLFAAHARIEEEIFYPEVFEEDTEYFLRSAVEEHLSVKRLLADLLEMTPDDDQFLGKMKVVKDLVQHHVEEEETELFPMLGDIEDEVLTEMGGRMLSLFEQLMESEPRNEVPQETEHAAQL